MNEATKQEMKRESNAMLEDFLEWQRRDLKKKYAELERAIDSMIMTCQLLGMDDDRISEELLRCGSERGIITRVKKEVAHEPIQTSPV